MHGLAALAIMSARRNLLREQPIFAQITAPSTDQDAFLPLHRGAAAVYNSTTQSFMDEYGNWIYLTPMVLGGKSARDPLEGAGAEVAHDVGGEGGQLVGDRREDEDDREHDGSG